MRFKRTYTKSLFNVEISIVGISHETIQKIRNAWIESGNPPPKIRADIPAEDEERLVQLMSECIKEKMGEISRRAKVLHLGMIYIHLNPVGKEKFLRILARKFDVNTKRLNQQIKQLQDAQTDEDKIQAELLLRKALVPPRVKLLRQLMTLPNGFIFLKDMRKDLLPLVKSIPRLKKLDGDLKNLLITYFDVNVLDMQEVNWDSPASTLEKLMEYEAVHEIRSWNDLKNRMFTDRRVYAFFHNKMPNDPLIFIEVALVDGIARNIQTLLDLKSPTIYPPQANTAIFYSISSTQKGLSGISFGNFLIKRVVKILIKEFPNIKTFATLSPIPRFTEWLFVYLKEGGDPLLKKKESKQISILSKKQDPVKGLLALMKSKNWYTDESKCLVLKNPLMRLCSHYLIYIKRKGRAFDPVANFHLSNGAKIQHLNWLGDTSEKGIKQSTGIMVNYHYRLNKIAENHEQYMIDGEVYASKEVSSYLK